MLLEMGKLEEIRHLNNNSHLVLYFLEFTIKKNHEFNKRHKSFCSFYRSCFKNFPTRFFLVTHSSQYVVMGRIRLLLLLFVPFESREKCVGNFLI